MSYQSGAIYQQQPQRFPDRSGGGDYYYDNENSTRYTGSERPYGRMATQGDRREDYSRNDARYDYGQDNYQRPSNGSAGQYRGPDRQDQGQYNRPQVNQYTDGPPHRYPETFQTSDVPGRQRRPSWEKSEPRNNWRNQPSNDTRDLGGNSVNEGYRVPPNHDRQPVTEPRSPTRTAQSTYSDNSRRMPPPQEQNQDFYRGEWDRRENNQSYQGSQYNRPREGQRSVGWQDQRNYNDRRGYQDERLPDDQFQSQGNARASGKYQPREENQYPARSAQQRDNYPPNRSNQALPPPPPQEYQSYEQREQTQRNYDQSSYEQYNSTPIEAPQLGNNAFRESAEAVPAPPQVLAETRGTAAVFGIVAKVDTSPTRRGPQPPASPTRDYAPSFPQYQERQQPPHSDSRQRLSQSVPHKPPSPPTSPRTRGRPDQRWPVSNENSSPTRKYGNFYDANQNRPSEQPQQPPYNKQFQAPYNEPRDRPPPASRGPERFRDEYTESSGYGSESTHNTDRSYGDQYNQSRIQHDDRTQYAQKPNESIHDNYDRNRPQERRSQADYSLSPPQQNYIPNRYDNEGQPPSQRPTENDRQYEPARDNYRYGGQQPPTRGQIGRDDRVPPQAEYGQPQKYYKDSQAPISRSYNKGQQDNLSRSPPKPLPERRYDTRDYLPNYDGSRNAHQDRKTGPPMQRNADADSGIEESHIKRVRDVKSMFERQTDPRRPPPGPKPVTAPKPPNINARPVPPRPRNMFDSGWNQQGDRNGFPPPPPQATSPRSPNYDRRFDDRRNLPHQEPPPAHSQSMDNLDDRRRYNGPSEFPDQRGPVQGSNEPRYNQGFRNSYSGDAVARPMVLGVKYNEDAPPASHSQDAHRSPEGRGRDSWGGRPNAPGPQYRSPQDREAPQQLPPTRGEWQREPPVRDNQQSYNNNNNWEEAQRRPAEYNQPRAPRRSDDEGNFVPDVVARSYEAFSQTATQKPEQQQRNGPFRSAPPEQQYNQAYDNQPPLAPQGRNWQDNPQNRSSTERWPTPPPPIDEQRSAPPNATRPMYDQNRPSQPKTDYSDDWRRPGPPPAHTGPPQYQPTRENEPPNRGPDSRVRFPQARDNRTDPALALNLPPPPRQPYNGDSDDSSEGIDVDAPTPPPSNKQLRAQHLMENRSNSPYELNKPIPITNRNTDSRYRRPYQDQNASQEPAMQRKQQPSAVVFQPHGRGSQKAKRQGDEEDQPLTGVRSPPPRKPQRNSVHLPSPQALNGEASPDNEQNEFDFDVGETQTLSHGASKQRQRLGRSGALANRKPPSRQGSTSNLIEAVGNDNDFQIEVTDSDLTQHPTPIEVHREESMRILRAKKAAHPEAKDTSSSSDVASSVIERPSKERSSQRNVPAERKEGPSAASDKKVDSKLLFKIPSKDVSKASTAHPIPDIKEPPSQVIRRPPTYTGFGNTVEPTKPKTDLLGQFKKARESAMKSAAAKQDKALKSVSAMVKFSNAKKQPKSPPKPKLTAAERNAAVLEEMNVEVKPQEEEHHRHHHHHKQDDRSDVKRSSTRSSSTVKPDKYDGDDDTTNGSRHDNRGRGKDRHHDDSRAKSRGRSRSRDRALIPENRGRGRSRSRERAISPERGKSRGRSRSRERGISPDQGKSRGRSRSRERVISPDDRNRPRRDYEDKRYNDRRRYDDEPPYHRRSHSPSREQYYPRPHYPQPYHRHPATREPDWVEQFRRGRERSSQPVRRAWVHDPRRVEVMPGGSRRELDMDEFERDVRRATSYNSDFEQPEPPRRQMIPAKLMARGPPPPRKQQSKDWMNALKEKNRRAERARLK